MIRWISLLGILLLSISASATEMVGAVSAGMGGTGRAAVEEQEAVYLNPAAISLVNKMHFSTAYQSGFLARDVSRNTYGLTIVDGSKDVLIKGAFAFRNHRINLHGMEFNENEFRLGLGQRLTKRFSLGLTLSHLKAESPDGVAYRQNNVDLGFLLGLRPNWGLSLTGENLVEQDQNIPSALIRPSRVALGTQYIYAGSITGRYELLSPLNFYNDHKPYLGHRFGLGIKFQADFVLNLGYSVDDFAEQNWSSIGLGWMGPRLKFAYSLQSESRQSLGTRHLVDLWVNL
ncbi:MAG: hypothetical protein KDD33_01600 [Bdellovibrionales bacterium]|nr:hypothetical protein [Bdellovibrionales bacterium]